MSAEIILVTGAAGGRQGSTGNHVARKLLARGAHVRALVHQRDQRSEALEALGAEVVAADLREIRDVRRVLGDVARVFFTYPVADGLLDASAVMAAAARDAGVKQLVNVSQLRPAPEAPTPRLRQHWVSEQVFNWAGVGAVHLRATVFYENLRALVAASLAEGTNIRLPWGDQSTVIPLVAAEDVANVAVGILLGAPQRNGQHFELIGGVDTLGEILEALVRVLGPGAKYEEVSDETWRVHAERRGVNPHAVAHLSDLWKAFRTGTAGGDPSSYTVSEHIRNLSGADPIGLVEFVDSQRQFFAALTDGALAGASR